ncbi:MAG: hypothetical protein MI865_10960 [Proteobacteria bacterium]|nr:hypothetical protein [Pseudomonadota bacterium]
MMRHKLHFAILLILVPSIASALGLGRLDLNSALNEPFDARIELLSPTADELDSLNVALADSEAFARAKIERAFILGNLRFALRRSVDGGPDYIRVFSTEPIREPFLNFLVEVSWSKGRLYREYTVLLDPPLYDSSARAEEFRNQVELIDDVASTIDDPEHKVVYAEDFEAHSASTVTPVSSPAIDYSGGDYGPTTGSDTLWSVASATRPDSSVSVNQMMLALLRANPEAFNGQNINGLRRGQILRMPDESELTALTNAQALAEVQSQYAAWGGTKDNLSTAVSERPEVSSVPEPVEAEDEEEVTGQAEEVVESDPELKLVAANESDQTTEQAVSVDSGTGNDLILANETIQALTQENIELKDRLQESETLLSDLKRLLELKDDELAALQEQMARSDAAAEAEEVIEEEPVAEEEEVIEEEPEELVEEEPVAEEEELIEEEPEEIIEVIDEPAPADAGIMGMVNQYLGPVKEMLLGNPIIGMAVGGVILLLLIVMVILKFKKEPAEVMHIDAPTAEAFPDFDSGDLGDTGGEAPDSEAVTALPESESEAETAMPEEEAPEFDLGTDDEEEEEKTQFIAPEAAAPDEEEAEEDPLQEVNTYLAFEQFDQAEEMVRNAINNDPENPEYYTKLLEVFYTSGNKKGYEEIAKVLHDKFGEADENWGMAVAMWQEMSPNRALFEEGADDEDDSATETTGGGFVDVTADEESGADDEEGLDFDIGTGAEAAETPATDSNDALDLTASEEGEDILDVTAAVGIEADSEALPEPGADEDMLDISGTGAGTGAEDLLDVTAANGTDEPAESTEASTDDDMLDLSAGSADSEDLLDVTAAADLELDTEEDLLDVTAATSAGADSDELLDVGTESESEAAAEPAGDDNVLDFDLAGATDTEAESGVVTDDPGAGGIELDTGDASDEEPVQPDSGDDSAGDGEISLDFDMGEATADTAESGGEISLDMDAGADSVAEEDGEISLDLDMGETSEGGIELDMSEADDGISLDTDSDSKPEISPDIAAESEEPTDGAELDFDLNMDTNSEEPAADIDLEGTVEMPKMAIPSEDDDDDDDEDHTVFVPRAAQPEEQSVEDEVATKLDLAKAYVELGDKESAKTILDEVMVEGNDEQKKQAEELLAQV